MSKKYEIKLYTSNSPVLKKFQLQPNEYSNDKGIKVLVLISAKKINSILYYSCSKWDSQILGVSVFKIIKFISSKSSNWNKVLLNYFINNIAKNSYIISRFPISSKNGINLFEKVGFYYLTGMVDLVFKYNSKNYDWANNSGVEVEFCKKKDIKYLEKIAEKSFLYDRYHSEKNIPVDKSNMLHKIWFQNCYKGNMADVVFVAKVSNIPVGFHACKIITKDKKKIAKIILIAVNKNYQNQGIGLALLNKAIKYFYGKVDKIAVRTEMQNMPAVNLYQKCGFSIKDFSAYYAYWNILK